MGDQNSTLSEAEARHSAASRRLRRIGEDAEQVDQSGHHAR